MLDTYSSPTTSTTQATAQNTTSAPVADPHQAAQERLAALLEELKADQLKPAAPKIEEVASLPLDNLAVQRPKSGLAQSQPTVEEQIDLIVPNPAGAYGQLMQKLNQKYRQGQPSLSDLMGMFKATNHAESATPSAENNLSSPAAISPASTPVQGFDSPEFLTALSKLPNPPAPAKTQEVSDFRPPAETQSSAVAQSPAETQKSPAKPRVINSYLQRLSTNLKQFGRLDLTSFHAAK